MARPTLPRCSTGQGARYSVALLIALLLSACTSNPGQPWQSTHGLGHPLTGKIWGVGAERFVTPEAMVTSLVRADLVLLGEKHDNADQHRLQAWLVGRLAAAGHFFCEGT